MNSPFANIFLALQQYIQTAVPAILYIDQDLGQLKDDQHPAVTFPCVLIDFEDFHFQNMGTNAQTANGTIVLRLGFTPTSPSSSGTPISYVESAIQYYDIEWDLHIALQGWSPGDSYGHFTRLSAHTQARHGYLRVREIRYAMAFDDYSTKPVQQYVAASEVVTTEIVLPTS